MMPCDRIILTIIDIKILLEYSDGKRLLFERGFQGHFNRFRGYPVHLMQKGALVQDPKSTAGLRLPKLKSSLLRRMLFLILQERCKVQVQNLRQKHDCREQTNKLIQERAHTKRGWFRD